MTGRDAYPTMSLTMSVWLEIAIVLSGEILHIILIEETNKWMKIKYKRLKKTWTNTNRTQ